MKKTTIFILFVIPCLLSSCFKEKRSDEAAEKMQNFVIRISEYARSLKPGFIILPQNGIELAFNYTDPSEGLNDAYMNAINGIGVEELFFSGNYAVDNERLNMLRQIQPFKTIMVADYLRDDNDLQEATDLSSNEGFISFPRLSSNYDYLQIPGNVPFANENDINAMEDARNYLYLISTDNFESREAMINAISATDYDLVLIDLFFEEIALSESEINQLKKKHNGAKRLVIAYMNIGSAEKFRYYWKDNWGLHHPTWIKRKYEGYDDEYWVKFWYDEWEGIILGNDGSYTKKIIDAGFDGAYLDNVEAYYFIYFRD